MTDRRIRKTQAAIERALRELLATRDFHDISVQDIANRADIVKSTFYNHYVDKYDLVEKIVRQKLNDFYNSQLNSQHNQINLNSDNLSQLQQFVNEIAIFEGIHDHELDVDELIKTWLANFLAKQIPIILNKRLANPKKAARLLAVLILEVLNSYAKQEQPITPAEVRHQLADLRTILEAVVYDLS